ncbi:uncharacterized protein LOC135389233 [Ornithodoros turicata]|uniref:uncharacterized protein LOC135389233 n=1 Tax=Ornithodoros turicata TaxID=34597 RepID=UPI0031397E43
MRLDAKAYLWVKEVNVQFEKAHQVPVYVLLHVLKKVFSIKKKQYQDEKRRKLVVESGQPPKYMGKWRFFSSLTFLDTKCPAAHDDSILGMEFFDVKLEPYAANACETLLSDANTSPTQSPSRDSSHTDMDEPVVQHVTNTRAETPPAPAHAAHRRHDRAQQRVHHSSPSHRPSAFSRIADVISRPTDECEAFGRLVECRMRRLPPSRYSQFQVEVLTFINQFEQSAANGES